MLSIDNGHINITYKRKKKKGRGRGKGTSVNAPKPPKISKGVILLDGNHFCDCEGNLHEAITNCRFCGRIVCEQEGLGECFYCKKEVVNDTESSKEAIERRDKMVSYDKNSKLGSVVIDDQLDHFESNIWLDKTKREDRAKKEKKLRELQKKIEDQESLLEYRELEKELKSNIASVNDNKQGTDEGGLILDPFSANIKIQGCFVNNQKKKKKRKFDYSDEDDRIQTQYFEDEQNEQNEENEGEEIE